MLVASWVGWVGGQANRRGARNDLESSPEVWGSLTRFVLRIRLYLPMGDTIWILYHAASSMRLSPGSGFWGIHPHLHLVASGAAVRAHGAHVRVSADNAERGGAALQLEAAAVLCCGVLVLLLADGTGSVCVVVCRLLIFEGPNSESRSRTNPRSITIGTRPPAIRVVVYCTVYTV